MINVLTTGLGFPGYVQVKLTLFRHSAATEAYPTAKSLWVQIFKDGKNILKDDPDDAFSIPIDPKEDFVKQNMPVYKVIKDILGQTVITSEIATQLFYQWVVGERDITHNLRRFNSQYLQFIKADK